MLLAFWLAMLASSGRFVAIIVAEDLLSSKGVDVLGHKTHRKVRLRYKLQRVQEINLKISLE